jgi:hypothetical protein
MGILGGEWGMPEGEWVGPEVALPENTGFLRELQSFWSMSGLFGQAAEFLGRRPTLRQESPDRLNPQLGGLYLEVIEVLFGGRIRCDTQGHTRARSSTLFSLFAAESFVKILDSP